MDDGDLSSGNGRIPLRLCRREQPDIQPSIFLHNGSSSKLRYVFLFLPLFLNLS